MVTEDLNLPLVTVIMPIRNEQRWIKRSLSSVLSQDYPFDRLEILVADGMSNDETRHIVREIARHDQRVRLIDNQARIMATGFNAALALSRGDVIVMLGGHAELSQNYMRTCARILKLKKADCVGGTLETACETRKSAAISLAMSSPFGVGNATFRIGATKETYVDTVAFGAYAREIVARAGPLDEEFVRNQDDEYNYRLRKLGARILLVPDIRCRYYSRTSLRSLWRQYFQYGYWKVRVMQKHPHQIRWRQFVPTAFIMTLLGATVLANFTPLGLAMLALVSGAYCMANIVASIRAAHKSGWCHFSLLPCAFATLHFSYGLGFLAGLIKFWNRWGDTRTRHSEKRL
ncbi:MAG: glycosyltransferase family 2 protein [Anaerolineae bacterium]|nr:glycosyltransferase family 2 protein [Anaerolineae bacterium]MCI0696572.1 glycosyltransferase family 2 protein [candidate division KSB1 bacterium]